MRRQDQRLLAAVRPSRVITFGSRARGDAGEGSDLDVIVVADSLEGMPFLKRMPFLLKLVQFEKHIDFLCYTEEEFRRAKRTSSLEQGMVVVDKTAASARGNGKGAEDRR